MLFKEDISDENGTKVYHLILAEEVSFFNKANVVKALDEIPENSKVVIDFSNSKSISYDVLELIRDYEINAKTKNILVEKIKYKDPYALGAS